MERRWGVPDNLRAALVARMAEIVLSAGTKPATAAKAFKALLDAEKLDLEAMRIAVDSVAIVQEEQRLSEADLAEGVARLFERKIAISQEVA